MKMRIAMWHARTRAAMIMKVILTNVSCKKGAATREGERRIKNTRRDRPREIDGGLSLGEQGRECAVSSSPPPFPPFSRARKDARGILDPLGGPPQDPHPHGAASRAAAAAVVGERQGNVRGVGGLYKAGARGGELSSSKRSVSVTLYRVTRSGAIVLGGDDEAHLVLAGDAHETQLSLVEREASRKRRGL